MSLIDTILDSILGSPWKTKWEDKKAGWKLEKMFRESKQENKKLGEFYAHQEHSESWYFSPEGEAAYAALSSDFDRIKFFLDYLILVAKKEEDKFKLSWHFTMLYRLAHVMCSSMVNSSLEFGGYPNILDENKNPLVKYVKKNIITYPHAKKDIYKNGTYCYSVCEEQIIKLLCALHNETDKNTKQYLSKKDPYKCLTFCDKNAPLSDMYKIERELMYMFFLVAHYSDEFDKKTLFIPYASSVMLENITPQKDSEDNLDSSKKN